MCIRDRVYGALNINAKNFDRELERTVKKDVYKRQIYRWAM